MWTTNISGDRLMLSEMLSVSLGSRKPLGLPLPVHPFIPATF
jgi:hypothetical protein